MHMILFRQPDPYSNIRFLKPHDPRRQFDAWDRAQELGRLYGGKICFVCPVSYQTTSISGSREDIFNDVRSLVQNLGCFHGGLVGYVEEYHSMGMSSDNYQACIQAFRTLGRTTGSHEESRR